MPQNVVSTNTLIKSLIAAVLLAALVLICIILPAEYKFDPTGIGQQLGLTALSAPTNENVPMAQPNSSIIQEKQIIEVTVPSGNGIEYKFYMQQYHKMTYEWVTDGPSLYFDLHGEPEGDSTGYFESYAIATSTTMKGSFTAPFNGSHGWYWKNNSNAPVTVKLTVAGQFEVIGLK